MPNYSTDTTRVSSVWSSYGHRFMSDGEENYESCLTCGAMYQLLALEDDPTRGEYVAADGSTPNDCSRDTSMSHGYPGERVCDECEDGACEHCAHDCNCVWCDS